MHSILGGPGACPPEKYLRIIRLNLKAILVKNVAMYTFTGSQPTMSSQKTAAIANWLVFDAYASRIMINL